MSASVFACVALATMPPTSQDLIARTRLNVATAMHLKGRIERVRDRREAILRFTGDAGDQCTSAGP
jgi:hypothetical protein